MTYQEEIARIQAETERIRRIGEQFKQTCAKREMQAAVQERLAGIGVK